jgi:tetratricopeptide (TPR) repeat protein
VTATHSLALRAAPQPLEWALAAVFWVPACLAPASGAAAPSPEPTGPALGEEGAAAGPAAEAAPEGSSATAHSAAEPAPVQAGAQELDEELRRLKRAAAEALERNDFAATAAALEALIGTPFAREGMRELARGRIEAALDCADRGLERAPLHVDLLLLRGECSLRLARPASEPNRGELLQRALESFRAAGANSTAHFGRSRALRELGRFDEALAAARAGAALPGKAARVPPEERFARSLSHAAWLAWQSAAERDDPSVRELAGTLDQALHEDRRDDPSDPWPWLRTAEFYLAQGRAESALNVAERGVFSVPRSAELHGQWTRLLVDQRGARALLEGYARFQAAHPQAAWGFWFPARERLERELGALAEDRRSELRDIEAEFKRARELDRALSRACLEQEALCRTGVGWCHLLQGRLEDAARVFESTEELFLGASASARGTELRSAREGLQQIARAWIERGELGQAAAAYASLHRFEPDRPLWARELGRFSRDHASRQDLAAGDMRRAERGELRDARRLNELREWAGIKESVRGTVRERELLGEAGRKLRARAREGYERSQQAFESAVRLDPRDLRSQVDAAAIAVYHLGTDLERWEATLSSVVEQARARVAEASLERTDLLKLEEAWGDAHQALGVLYLDRRGDAAAALPLLEASLKIGSAPRPDVEHDYLPRARAALGVPPRPPED